MRTMFTIPARSLTVAGTTLLACVALGASALGAAQAVPNAPTDATVQARMGSELHNDEKLAAGESLTSPNAQFRFDVQFDGNAVVYNTRTKRPVWDTKTDGKGEVRLHMQTDGNLVLYTVDKNTPVWETRSEGGGDEASKTLVRIADNGSLQVVRSTKVIWNSPAAVDDTPSRPTPTSSPTRPTPTPSRPTSRPTRPVRETTLEQGRAITVGGFMTSENGKYRFGLRSDNTMYVSLVSTGRVLWGLKLRGDAAQQVGVNDDGDLVLLRRDGRVLWSTKLGVKTTRARLVMQNDGNAVLYHGDEVMWDSNTTQP